jgi:hypothetical protein
MSAVADGDSKRGTACTKLNNTTQHRPESFRCITCSPSFGLPTLHFLIVLSHFECHCEYSVQRKRTKLMEQQSSTTITNNRSKNEISRVVWCVFIGELKKCLLPCPLKWRFGSNAQYTWLQKNATQFLRYEACRTAWCYIHRQEGLYEGKEKF